jgi:hypothetical protein
LTAAGRTLGTGYLLSTAVQALFVLHDVISASFLVAESIPLAAFSFAPAGVWVLHTIAAPHR